MPPAQSQLKAMEVEGMARRWQSLVAQAMASGLQSMLRMKGWALEGEEEDGEESWERMHREVRGRGPQPRKAKRVRGAVGLAEWRAESSIWVRST